MHHRISQIQLIEPIWQQKTELRKKLYCFSHHQTQVICHPPSPGVSSDTYPWWQAPNLQREAMQQLEGHSPSSSSASSASVQGASAQGDPDTWNNEEQNLNTRSRANDSVADPESRWKNG